VRLAEFFQKTRELYPDYSLQTNKQFAIGDHVITQWTLDVTITETFYVGLTKRTPISISGISVVRTKNGEITDWADYYDGLTARRTALSARLTESVNAFVRYAHDIVLHPRHLSFGDRIILHALGVQWTSGRSRPQQRKPE